MGSLQKHKKDALWRGKKAMRFRQSLFWDVNPKTIDPKKHAFYIIERILEFGNDKEIAWMYGIYSSRLLRNVIKGSRVLHPQTKALWKALTRR